MPVHDFGWLMFVNTSSGNEEKKFFILNVHRMGIDEEGNVEQLFTYGLVFYCIIQ